MLLVFFCYFCECMFKIVNRCFNGKCNVLWCLLLLRVCERSVPCERFWILLWLGTQVFLGFFQFCGGLSQGKLLIWVTDIEDFSWFPKRFAQDSFLHLFFLSQFLLRCLRDSSQFLSICLPMVFLSYFLSRSSFCSSYVSFKISSIVSYTFQQVRADSTWLCINTINLIFIRVLNRY